MTDHRSRQHIILLEKNPCVPVANLILCNPDVICCHVLRLNIARPPHFCPRRYAARLQSLHACVWLGSKSEPVRAILAPIVTRLLPIRSQPRSDVQLQPCPPRILHQSNREFLMGERPEQCPLGDATSRQFPGPTLTAAGGTIAMSAGRRDTPSPSHDGIGLEGQPRPPLAVLPQSEAELSSRRSGVAMPDATTCTMDLPPPQVMSGGGQQDDAVTDGRGENGEQTIQVRRSLGSNSREIYLLNSHCGNGMIQHGRCFRQDSSTIQFQRGHAPF